MQDTFDGFEYFDYLRSRWRFTGACCLIAAVLAGGVTLLLPSRFTARASILIDAPAGNDPRAATAVSPVYLESLRTYEQLAASDTLFARAIERYHLRAGSGSAAHESLKQRVLKVAKPRDTKLLEISVTLDDAAKAQAVAQFIAEETVSLNRSLSKQWDDEYVAEARRQSEAAKARLDAAESAWARETGSNPTESLEAEFKGLVELKTRLVRELASADIDSAEYGAQQNASAADPAGARPDEARLTRRDVAVVKARIETLRKQLQSVDREIAAKETALVQRRALASRLDAERHAARIAFDAAAAHVTEVQTSAGSRGERLKIIDPGIVPQRPSDPNLPLNVMVSVLVALIVSVVYLTAASNSVSKPRYRPIEAVRR